MGVIRHPWGNPLLLRIPLTVERLTVNGGTVDRDVEDFYPAGETVDVVFQDGARQVKLVGSVVDGHYASVDASGLKTGDYSFEVFATGADGLPYRFKQTAMLVVVDITARAGVASGVEFIAQQYTLDASVYQVIQGPAGRGIDHTEIVESQDSGGENRVTIYYTDCTVDVLTVLNGRDGGGGIGEETDPTVPQHVKSITQSDIDKWNNKPDKQRTVLYMTASRTPSFTDVDGNALTHSQVRELLNSSKELDVLIYFAEQLYPCILALSQPDQWYFAVIYTGDEAGYLRIYYDERTGIYHDFYTMQFVPYSRKVNNKPLSNDITLSASDVGAMPVGTFIPALANNLTTTVANYALDARQGKVLSDLISKKLSFACYTDEDERDSDSEERHMCYIEDTGFFLYDFVTGEWVQISTGGKGIAGISTHGEGDIVITLDNGDTYSLNLNHTHTNLAQKNGSEDESFTSNFFRVADGGRSGEGVDVTSFFDDSEEVVMLAFSDSWNGSTLNYAFSQDKPADAFIATEEYVAEYVTNRLITPIVTNSSSGSVTQNLEPNKFYKFTGALTALTIGLPLVRSGGLNIFFGKFTAGTGGCTFGYPSSVNPAPSVPSTFEEGKTYEFSIMDNELFIVEA